MLHGQQINLWLTLFIKPFQLLAFIAAIGPKMLRWSQKIVFRSMEILWTFQLNSNGRLRKTDGTKMEQVYVMAPVKR